MQTQVFAAWARSLSTHSSGVAVSVSPVRLPALSASCGQRAQGRINGSFGAIDVSSLFALAAGAAVCGSMRQRALKGRRHLSARTAAAAPLPSSLKLHIYDHCPFCLRAELTLGWLGIPYERVLYNYGQGANPDSCGGTGYEPTSGPIALTGMKMLPVLEGEGVPAPSGMVGLPESLEICSYVVALAPGGQRIAPATGRGDLTDWMKRFGAVCGQLLKPRIIKVPVKDWSDARDAEYARWKYTTKAGFDYEAAEAATPQLLEEMADLLAELEPMIRGEAIPSTGGDPVPCMNVWGFSMDDILVLPNLRNLTCVAGVKWPAGVRGYMEKVCAKAGLALYDAYAS